MHADLKKTLEKSKKYLKSVQATITELKDLENKIHADSLKLESCLSSSTAESNATDSPSIVGTWCLHNKVPYARNGSYVRAHSAPVLYVDLAPWCKQHEHWIIEENNGKFTIMSSENKHEKDVYLSALANESVILTSEAEENALWTPEKNDDGSWSFRSSLGTMLSACNTEKGMGTRPWNFRCEHFWLESPPPTVSNEDELSVDESTVQKGNFSEILGVNCLKTHDNLNYVRALREPYSTLDSADLVPYCRSAERFVISEKNGKVSLMNTIHGLEAYLSFKTNGSVGLITLPENNSLWTPLQNDDGSWSFVSSLGTWLSACTENGLMVTTSQNESCVHFWLESPTDIRTEEATTEESTAEESTTEESTTTTSNVAEILGIHCLKADKTDAEGKYVRAHWTYSHYLANKKPGQKYVPPSGFVERPDLVTHCLEYELWTISERDGKVSLQNDAPSRETGVMFLSAKSDGTVELVSSDDENSLWTPEKNEDGTWSFVSSFGKWLTACYDNEGMGTKPFNKRCEHFSVDNSDWTPENV